MVQRGRNGLNTKTSVTGSWAEMRKGWPGWQQRPGFRWRSFLGPLMCQAPHRLKTGSCSCLPSHSILPHCPSHLSCLCALRTPQHPVPKRKHALPRLRAFVCTLFLPGMPSFFLSLSSYIYLQELAKYFLSHGHSSNCIPSHIRGRSNCFLICDIVLESQSQVRFLSLPVNAVRSWTYYLTSLCSKFLSRVMGIITITIPSLTKL